MSDRGNPRKQKEATKKKNASRGQRITVWVPPYVLHELDQYALREGCSRSWAITESVVHHLQLDEEEIARQRGYAIPKTFEERKNTDWTPEKKKKKKKGGEHGDRQ